VDPAQLPPPLPIRELAAAATGVGGTPGAGAGAGAGVGAAGVGAGFAGVAERAARLEQEHACRLAGFLPLRCLLASRTDSTAEGPPVLRRTGRAGAGSAPDIW
jgi:hypothetical protein